MRGETVRTRKYKTIEERIFTYVENFWLRHNLEQEPTIREVARGINSGSKKVYDAIESGNDYGKGNDLWIESIDDIPERGRIDYDEIFIGCDSPKIDKKWYEVMRICEKCHRMLTRDDDTCSICEDSK